MTNLPITTSTPQTATATKQASSAGEAADTQNSQPFGAVLARQLGTPAGKDAKVDDKLGADALAQLLAGSVDTKKDALDIKKDATDIKKDAPDIKNTDTVASDSTSTLPADMLATLLPQALNSPVTTTTTSAKSDTPAISTVTTNDKADIGAMKADVAATAQTDTAPKATTGTPAGTQVREQAFAAALIESANRNATGMELRTAARDAVTASTAAQQSGAAALAALQNNTAPVMQPVQMTVNTAVNQDKWSDEFSQKITWLASSNKDQSAELHLNPPQLGPVDVVIKVSGDQATALFTSPHAAVREAIEQAMPKLRDMMADNGIMLGNATVSDQAPRDQGQSNAQRSAAPTGNDIRDTAVAGISTARVSQISRHNGIVDTFA